MGFVSFPVEQNVLCRFQSHETVLYPILYFKLASKWFGHSALNSAKLKLTLGGGEKAYCLVRFGVLLVRLS